MKLALLLALVMFGCIGTAAQSRSTEPNQLDIKYDKFKDATTVSTPA